MSRKHDYEFIKKGVESRGFELLSNTYEGTFVKLKIRCKNNHIIEKTWDKISHGRGCAICSRKNKKTIEEINETFKKEGYIVLTKKYINAKQILDVICPNGHTLTKTIDAFTHLGRRCNQCHLESNVGENHSNWDPRKTDEERLNARNTEANKSWRNSIFKRDNFHCRKCNVKGVTLNAHHIENYSEVKDKRFDLDNGITFCYECHKEFHANYGFRNNNAKQLEKFLLNDRG